VSFLGAYRGEAERAAFFGSIDIFALSSLGESFSYVCAEAMASGRPVVASRVGGIPEFVEHGRTGYCVEPRNPAAMATAIIALLENPEKLRAMGSEGREVAERKLSLDAHVETIAQLFEQLRASRKA
jgi:glycosyltransferase involved in cell wall biosynthesis